MWGVGRDLTNLLQTAFFVLTFPPIIPNLVFKNKEGPEHPYSVCLSVCLSVRLSVCPVWNQILVTFVWNQKVIGTSFWVVTISLGISMVRNKKVQRTYMYLLLSDSKKLLFDPDLLRPHFHTSLYLLFRPKALR